MNKAFIDVSARDRRILDESSAHKFGCSCDVCLSWWALMGPEPDEPDGYGPFTKEQVNMRQRELDMKETQ